MSCTVDRTGSTQSTSGVEETKPADDTKVSAEERKASYDETKESIKGMDDVLKQAQEADPGNKDIQKARDDLKELDGAVDDVFNSTNELEKAHEGGNPQEIEDKYNDAIDAQMKFGEKYEQASDSLEKLTGAPLPPL